MSQFLPENQRTSDNNYNNKDSFDEIAQQLELIQQNKLLLLREISSYQNIEPDASDFKEVALLSEISTSLPKDEQNSFELREKESHLYKKMNQFLLTQNQSLFLSEINSFKGYSEKPYQNTKYETKSVQLKSKKIKKQKSRHIEQIREKAEDKLDFVKELFSEFAVKFDEESSLFTQNLSQEEHSLYNLNNESENEIFKMNNSNQDQFQDYCESNFFADNILEKSKQVQNSQGDTNEEKLFELYNYISVIEKMLDEVKKQLFSMPQ